MKNRSILKMILLTIVTLGIYYLYWMVTTSREMRKLGAEIPNALLIIVPIVQIWWTWKYCQGVEKVTDSKMSTIVAFLLLYLVGFIGIYIVQDTFNGLKPDANVGSVKEVGNDSMEAKVPGPNSSDSLINPANSVTTAAAATGAAVVESQKDQPASSPEPAITSPSSLDDNKPSDPILQEQPDSNSSSDPASSDDNPEASTSPDSVETPPTDDQTPPTDTPDATPIV